MVHHEYVLHYPGRNPVSGDYRGRDGLEQFVDALKELGIDVTRELHDALASKEHGIQLVTVRADRDGNRHQWNGVVVMHFRDAKIVEAWVHIDDQHALDEFLSVGGS
jgi:ketosteroid isomerase-like protein